MRMRIAVALFLAASVPVSAAPACSYVNESGDIAIKGPVSVSVAYADGRPHEECATASLGTGIAARMATCGEPVIKCEETVGGAMGATPVLGETCHDLTPTSVVFSAKSRPDGPENDILIFQNTVWYLMSCGEDAPA